jgi:two-component system, chemotaxis family, protein-glutamate methylesterase/glutaminase
VTVESSTPPVVVVGASAGGVGALRRLIGALPVDLPAALLVVLHVPRNSSSVLPDILSRSGALPARHGRDGDRLRPGVVFVAPPNHHMLVKERTLRVTVGPEENGHRPSIDALFRSAAAAHGPRATGVVLSGALDDGTAGLLAISRAGGTTMVQDPDDALYPAMPASALATVPVDAVGPVEALAHALVAALRRFTRGDTTSPGRPVDVLEQAMEAPRDTQPDGSPSRFTCPACGGSLWRRDEDAPPYRCRVGHAFSDHALLSEQDRALEAALWTAARVLEERAEVTRRLRDDAADAGRTFARKLLEQQLHELDRNRGLIRVALENELGRTPDVADVAHDTASDVTAQGQG